MRLFLFATWFLRTFAFAPRRDNNGTHRRMKTKVDMTRHEDEKEPKFSLPNPIQELGEMFSNMDAVVDDFFNKRMGNCEIFYGKRKYKPSGSVQGEYNGFGLTDKLKIDVTRARKEEYMEKKRLSDEES